MDISDRDMEAVFNSLDPDGSGELALNEFLNELKREPDPQEAQWLRFGIGHQYVQPNREPPATKGVVAEPWLSGFNRGNRTLVAGAPESRRTSTAPTAWGASTGDGDADTALQMLRDFFSRRKTSALLTLFQDVDTDQSGKIEQPEFCAALRQLNMHLSEEDMKTLFRHFDKDGSGICEVREIVQELRIEPSAEESRWYRTGIGRQTLYPSRDVYIQGVQPSSGQSGFARSVNPAPPMKWMPTSRAQSKRPASARSPASIFR